MRNYRATRPVYGLESGTEILNELGGYYARIDGWQGSYYYATELLLDDYGGYNIEGDVLKITPIDLIGCEIFEK